MAAGARWSKTKDSLAGDSRYKAMHRDQREALFRQYVAEQEVRAANIPTSLQSARSTVEC